MLKKTILLTYLWSCLFQLNAQVSDNLKLTLEVGILPIAKNNENLEFFLYAEPKLKVANRSFLGLRLGLTLNAHSFDNKEKTQFNLNQEQGHALLSFIPTFDYYLSGNHAGAYVGAGVGIHLLSDIDVARTFVADPADAIIEVRVNRRIGLLFRGGFELGKLRLGLEYNFIPKADIEIPNEKVIGTVANSYLGLSIGYTFGGKKSDK